MSQTIQFDQQTLRLNGDWTAVQVAANWEQLSACEADCLDLVNLKRIDSAGIAAIITALKPEPSNPLAIKHCTDQAKQLFKLYELEPLLTFEE
ncbi:hypothetical protein M0C34_17295 [Agarivorans sp. TSD2052]|uniref:STAS domain-containing protein n=1 Tax=Agarivorans sp. TSD2052 TaxID=2937286 RepID=UPI00200F97E7|nr:hypothetical protein [Agarivorans sp. TSD2052]UPW17967.1 hypothetical protein M0C34_17295 [Agarivorans sp. TSD2052]